MALVKVDVEDFVAVVTMDNPPVNAIAMDMLVELTHTFDALGDRDDVRVIVLTGAGKHFCAGADLKNRPDLEEPGLRARRNRMVRESSYSIMDNTLPVIAAVNGSALGAGLGLAASCDILVASERAVFGLPEVDVGLMGGGKHAARIFPHSLVRRMMVSGYRVTAKEACDRGVIEAALPHDELMPWAMDLARLIASKSPLATRMAKDSMRAISEMPMRDGYIYEQGNTAKLSTSHDAAEAVAAFVEKRAPNFKGC
ncbi:enoyl-CoA hydratase/isomerase family protein [Pseudooceanicola nitratireducens]|uniref:enoyl-CoA hydratase/isomerase family protein n=1 Tax=Pseudooceanicola nitratireducens TaxID=517719 RepID=UPI0023F57476|nr:enoyl-CoA hydratase/isomerase family protein [Pseudooceanicola nitratireducens]